MKHRFVRTLKRPEGRAPIGTTASLHPCFVLDWIVPAYLASV